MKPQEVKPKAQIDWLGFRKGVRTYVQRASLMMPSPETATKATMSLHVTAEHMSSKFTPIPFSYKAHAILTQNAPPARTFVLFLADTAQPYSFLCASALRDSTIFLTELP